MRWNLDGSVELLEDEIEIPRSIALPEPRDDDDWQDNGDGEQFNQDEEDALMEIEANCANGACDDEIQRSHVLTYKVIILNIIH